MSTSHQRRPCVAERGNAWWLWCHDSPSDGIASQKTFVDSSSVWKRRRPKKWQIELIEKVTWWTRKMRTRPAQKSAWNPAISDPVTAQPMANGSASPSATQSPNKRLMTRMPRSSSRSGANFPAPSAVGWSKSQPRWACHSPLSAPASSPSLATWGLCGSPSSSAKAWWRRWSVTQPITGPSTASEPKRANRYSSGLWVWNARCVSRRWKPTVIPTVERKYMTASRIRSSGRIQSFQSTGIAARNARKGSTTAAMLMLRCARVTRATYQGAAARTLTRADRPVYR